MGFNYFSTTPLAIPGVARTVYDGLASQNNFARVVQQKQLQIAERQVRLQELQAESDRAYRESQAKFQQLAADDRDEDRKLQAKIEARNQAMFDFSRDEALYERNVTKPLEMRLKASQEARLARGQVVDAQRLDYSNRYLKHEQDRLAEDRRQFDLTREDEMKGVRKRGATAETGKMSDVDQKKYRDMEKIEDSLREQAKGFDKAIADARKAEDEAAGKVAQGAPDSPATKQDLAALRRARVQRQAAEAERDKVLAQADEAAKQRNAFLATLERAQGDAVPQESATRVIRQMSNEQIVEEFRARGKAYKLNLNEINRDGLLNRIGRAYNTLTDAERDDLWERIRLRYGTTSR